MSAPTKPEQALAVLPQNNLPAEQEWGTILSMAETLIKSGFLPDSVKSPEAAAAIILKGREMGIPPMQAFSHVHIIKGKSTCSSELMLAILARGGVTWTWLEYGEKGKAVIEFHRHRFAPVKGSYSLKEAQAAKLTGKDNWKQYAPNMLRARAISNGARMIGPDLLAGMSYTPEELGAQVDEEGSPIDAEPMTIEFVQTETIQAEPAPAQEPNENGKKSDYYRFLDRCGALKDELGEEGYYAVLKEFDLGKANEVGRSGVETMKAVVNALEKALAHPSRSTPKIPRHPRKQPRGNRSPRKRPKKRQTPTWA